MESDADERAHAAKGAQVPGEDPMGQRVMAQALDFWIRPEIERRRQAGRLPEPFQLNAAQIVMNVGEPPEVRLNAEVQAVLRGRAKRSIAEGEMVGDDDVEVETLLLTDLDPNAGHLTLLRHKDHWFLSFDFRYNAARAGDASRTAREFLETADDALRADRMRPFAENLFAAMELVARGELMMIPNPALLKSKKHEYVISQYNRWGKLGHEHT